MQGSGHAVRKIVSTQSKNDAGLARPKAASPAMLTGRAVWSLVGATCGAEGRSGCDRRRADQGCYGTLLETGCGIRSVTPWIPPSEP